MEKKNQKNPMMMNNGKKLLFFSLPLQGHITPMLQLADILHSKGFSITFLHTNYNAPDPTNHPHFTFRSISETLSESEASELSVFDLASLLNVKCLEPFHHCLTQLFSEESELNDGGKRPPYSCLISDPVMHFAGEVAKRFDLPRFVLRTSGVGNFLAFDAVPMLHQKGYLPFQASRLEDPVVELPPLRVKDLPFFNVTNPDKFYKLLASLNDEARASSGVIFNSYEELETSAIDTLRREFPCPIFPIGPFHRYFPAASSSLLKPDESAITWLDKQAPKSVIYVSFGSIAAIKEEEFLEIAWGLANSKHPFLWVIRPGSVHGHEWHEALPNGFLENLHGRGHVVKWAPQLEVLAHPSLGAFWTHCGWNSTLESICEGVPMICKPCFTDQMLNTRYITHVWKVGVELDNGLERKSIEKTIQRLMVDDEIRKNALDMKQKAEFTLEQGGGSYESLTTLMSCLSSY